MVVWSTRASKTLKEHCIFMNRWLKDWSGQNLSQSDLVEGVNSPTVLPCCQAITTPAMAVSHIMLEAYKKYILVSLILHGKVQPLPKYTSQIVGRFIKVRMCVRACVLVCFLAAYMQPQSYHCTGLSKLLQQDVWFTMWHTKWHPCMTIEFYQQQVVLPGLGF